MPVELLGVLGNDLTVVNAARVSYGKHKETMDEADIGLLGFLARNHHGTPFEHVVFQFRVSTSIKVAREWFRHRIGSFNEVSTRYVELAWDFYTPKEGDVRKQVGKPGNYRFEAMDPALAEVYITAVEQKHARDRAFYEVFRDLGVAKELLSFELPMSLLTEFYWTVNFRSLTNFLSLRTAPSALLEFRIEAEKVGELVKQATPELYNAWLAHGGSV